MPVFVRVLAILVAGYALSPIDLIPDFIPVLGYLDDLLIVTVGLSLVLKFTPPAVLESARIKACQTAKKPVNYGAAIFIIGLWLLALFILAKWVIRIVLTPEK